MPSIGIVFAKLLWIINVLNSVGLNFIGFVSSSGSETNGHNDGQGHGKILVRRALADDAYRWPKGIVPYVIPGYIDEHVWSAIYGATHQIEQWTCVHIVPKTRDHSGSDYLKFVNGSSCHSDVGRQGIGPQTVTVGSECATVAQMIHILMHAIGFEHEYQRPDRDKHMKINWKNIPTGDRHFYEKFDGVSGRPLAKTLGNYCWSSKTHQTIAKIQLDKHDKDSLSMQPVGINMYGEGWLNQIGKGIALSPCEEDAINAYYGCPNKEATALDAPAFRCYFPDGSTMKHKERRRRGYFKVECRATGQKQTVTNIACYGNGDKEVAPDGKAQWVVNGVPLHCFRRPDWSVRRKLVENRVNGTVGCLHNSTSDFYANGETIVENSLVLNCTNGVFVPIACATVDERRVDVGAPSWVDRAFPKYANATYERKCVSARNKKTHVIRAIVQSCTYDGITIPAGKCRIHPDKLTYIFCKKNEKMLITSAVNPVELRHKCE